MFIKTREIAMGRPFAPIRSAGWRAGSRDGSAAFRRRWRCPIGCADPKPPPAGQGAQRCGHVVLASGPLPDGRATPDQASLGAGRGRCLQPQSEPCRT
jgi:hypothetical protein